MRACTCRAQIGDYTDFYVGIHHATNVGKLFRPDNPLLPNYKWVPIGYHGRASSVRASGAAVRRPNGQRKPPERDAARASARASGWTTNWNSASGSARATRSAQPIPIGEADEHIAGLLPAQRLVGARHPGLGIPAARPVPGEELRHHGLAWIVTPEALAPFRAAQPPRPEGDPAAAALPARPTPTSERGALDIELEVLLRTAAMRERRASAPHRVAHGSRADMYWTLAQMVAHHAVNGCNLQPATCSAPARMSGRRPGDGSARLLEMTEGGSKPIELAVRRDAHASSRTATR